MKDQLTAIAKQYGTEIITLSEANDSRMDKWSDLPKRPMDMTATEFVGFINKETETDGLSFVVDLVVKIDADEAVLRTWLIASEVDENGIERFNNVQLDFGADHAAAFPIAAEGSGVTRADLQSVLDRPDTHAKRLIVSSKAALDQSGAQLGERYDVVVDEDEVTDEQFASLVSALESAMAALKRVA